MCKSSAFPFAPFSKSRSFKPFFQQHRVPPVSSSRLSFEAVVFLSRFPEMETSRGTQPPAYTTMAQLASSVTWVGTWCMVVRCSCETRLRPSAQRTHNWTLAVTIIANGFGKWSLAEWRER